jgi:hypothetical protein
VPSLWFDGYYAALYALVAIMCRGALRELFPRKNLAAQPRPHEPQSAIFRVCGYMGL